MDAFIELGQRDDADCEAFGFQFAKLLSDRLDAAEVVDDPVGINEIGRVGHVRRSPADGWQRDGQRRYSASFPQHQPDLSRIRQSQV